MKSTILVILFLAFTATCIFLPAHFVSVANTPKQINIGLNQTYYWPTDHILTLNSDYSLKSPYYFELHQETNTVQSILEAPEPGESYGNGSETIPCLVTGTSPVVLRPSSAHKTPLLPQPRTDGAKAGISLVDQHLDSSPGSSHYYSSPSSTTISRTNFSHPGSFTLRPRRVFYNKIPSNLEGRKLTIDLRVTHFVVGRQGLTTWHIEPDSCLLGHKSVAC